MTKVGISTERNPGFTVRVILRICEMGLPDTAFQVTTNGNVGGVPSLRINVCVDGLKNQTEV